jgi:cytochrome c-type biogenesis protein CcmH/NrfF
MVLLLCFVSLHALAEDVAIREKRLFRQIRCSACQGQSIDESNTPQANLAKEFVVEQIKLGKTDDEILVSVREEYGDFLVFRPQFSIHTFVLWALPVLLLALCIKVIKNRVDLS